MKKTGLAVTLLMLALLLPPAYGEQLPIKIPLRAVTRVYLVSPYYQTVVEIVFFLRRPAYFHADFLAPMKDVVIYLNGKIYSHYSRYEYLIPPDPLLVLKPGLHTVTVYATHYATYAAVELNFAFNETAFISPPFHILVDMDFPVYVYSISQLQGAAILDVVTWVFNPTPILLSSLPEAIARCPNLDAKEKFFRLKTSLLYDTYPPSPCRISFTPTLREQVPFDRFEVLWNITYPDGFSELSSTLPSFVLPGTLIRNASPLHISSVMLPSIHRSEAIPCFIFVNGSRTTTVRFERGVYNLTLTAYLMAYTEKGGMRASDDPYIYSVVGTKMIRTVTPVITSMKPLPVRAWFDASNPFNVSLKIPVGVRVVELPNVLRIYRDLTVSSEYATEFELRDDKLLVNVSIPSRTFLLKEKSIFVHIVGTEEALLSQATPLSFTVRLGRRSIVVIDGRRVAKATSSKGDGVPFICDQALCAFTAEAGDYTVTLLAKLRIISESESFPVSSEVKIVDENERVVAEGKGSILEFYVEPGKTYRVHAVYADTMVVKSVVVTDDSTVVLSFPPSVFVKTLFPFLLAALALLVIIAFVAARHAVTGTRRFVKHKKLARAYESR